MPDNAQELETQPQEEKPLPFAVFLTTVPPGTTSPVTDIFDGDYLAEPLITMHCENQLCDGTRIFHKIGAKLPVLLPKNESKDVFAYFACRNCGHLGKTFAIRVRKNEKWQLFAFKIGENPPFGERVPARVITMIGPDREQFLKGRRAENQGMGIGAFAYYRRVVENQKGRIIDEMVRVGERLGAPSDMLADLRSAKAQQQFSASVDAIKHGIPDALKINGQNPLTLLHSALSEGMHAQTDEECLELATSIRVVLADLAERMGNALREQGELDKAVARLMQAKPK